MNTSALILTIFLFLGSVYFGLGIIEKIKFLAEKQNEKYETLRMLKKAKNKRI